MSVFPRLLSLSWTPSNTCSSLKFGVVYPDTPLLSGDTLLVTPIVAEVVSDAFEVLLRKRLESSSSKLSLWER